MFKVGFAGSKGKIKQETRDMLYRAAAVMERDGISFSDKIFEGLTKLFADVDPGTLHCDCDASCEMHLVDDSCRFS